MNFKGVIVPIITPLTDGGVIDELALAWLVEFLIKHGVHGLFPGGTTGEGPLLSIPERLILAETVVKTANHRIPVIVHAGAISTQQTIQLAQHAEMIGADGIAVIPPYFYRYDEDALFYHYEAVLKSVPNLPVFLYNNPFIYSNSISYSLAKILSDKFKNVVGIKDSSGQLDFLNACGELRNGEFLTFVGNDKFILDALSMGIDGCVAGNANVVPELFVTLYNSVQDGDVEKARKIHKQIETLLNILGNGNIPLFKNALELRGLPKSTTRLPLRIPPKDITEESKKAFIAFSKNNYEL